MSLGDRMLGVATKILGSWSGDPSDLAAGNFVSNILDVMGTDADLADANARTEAAYQLAQGLALQTSEQGMRDAAYNTALRDAIYGNIASQEDIMFKAFNAIGAPNVVNPDVLNARTAALETQYLDDVNAAAALTNSQGYADNIMRGVGDSTLEDTRRVVSAKNLARERMQARNQAYADAVGQETARESLFAANRGNIMKQYADLYNVPLANKLKLYEEAPNYNNAFYTAGGLANNVYGKVQDYGKSAAKAAGTAWTDFGKQLAGQMDDYFGRKKTNSEAAIST